MDLELVTKVERLREVQHEWDELLAATPANIVTLSPLWLLAWWDVFGERRDRELRCALLWENNRLAGIAPLLTRPTRSAGAIPIRRLELLASGEHERHEICSDYIGIITRSRFEQPVAETVASALKSGVFGEWDDIVLRAMDATTITPPLLATSLSPIRTSYAITGASPYIPLPKSWDAYLDALSANARYLVKRSLRDFEKWAGNAKLTVATSASDLETGRTILESLHRERWEAAGKTGVFDSARFRAFHDQVMPRLAERGALELCWLEAHGRPIAALYNLVWNGRVMFYQGGRALDLPKNIRPGIVAHAHAIRRAIELGRREYDFLAGDARYKLDLSLDYRPLSTLYATRRPLLPKIQFARDYVVGKIRRVRSKLKSSAKE
jgi:CelD/BcsL family acetyltransferase involved in cellulose biosynthesis